MGPRDLAQGHRTLDRDLITVWLVYGIGSVWFWVAVLGGAAVELWTIRQLGREWAYEARSSWWWAP
jgi:hypothetical protein